MKMRSLFGAVCLLFVTALVVSARPTATRGNGDGPGGRVISGVNLPPLRPVNIDPSNGAFIKVLDEGVLLRATPFRDPNPPRNANGRQRFAQWVVKSLATDEVIVNSGPTTRTLTMFPVRAALLQTSASFAWSVRYADASGKADSMWSSWSLPTRFTVLPEVVKNITPDGVKLDVTRPGESVYADKKYPLIVEVPKELQGNPFLQTLSTDAKTTAPGTLISFTSDLPTTVVVAYDNRATTLPLWLQAFKPLKSVKPMLPAFMCPKGEGRPPIISWIKSKIVVSDRQAPLRVLLAKGFAAGELVELGSNLSDTTTTTTRRKPLAMYSVIVVPDYTGIIPPPTPKPTPRPRPTPKPSPTPMATPMGRR